MSTRGTVIFLEEPLENMNRISDSEFNNYPTIYVHSDMYPSGALPRIDEFLQTKGAKSRGCDSSYISAWFVAFIANGLTKYGTIRNDQDESPLESGLRYIKEIRAKMTKGKKALKKLEQQEDRYGPYMYQVHHALDLDINKFLKESDDFIGVGLQIGLNDWCDYTYVIVPIENKYNTDGFRIYVYGYDYRLIDVYRSGYINLVEE